MEAHPGGRVEREEEENKKNDPQPPGLQELLVLWLETQGFSSVFAY